MLAYDRVNRLPLARVAGRLIGALAGDTKIRKYAPKLFRLKLTFTKEVESN